MTPASRSFFLHLTSLVMTATALASCSSTKVGDGASISKVKYYHLLPTQLINVADPAIMFEKQHFLYGAVTKAEVLARGGHYYTLFWKVQDRAEPVTIRFEYRQAGSGLQTKVMTQEVSDIHRSNTTDFVVNGDEYNKFGRVTSWRMTVMRGKLELVSSASYLWK